MPLSEPRFDAEQLKRLATRALKAAGARPGDAAAVADHLVEANRAGHDSHGIGMLPAYVRHCRDGLVALDTEPEIIQETPVILQMDAKGSWGAPAARTLLDRACEKARTCGLAAATLGNAHHIGRVGALSEQVSAQGLISLHFINVTDHAPLVAPFRGSDARFGTNPVCIGFPATPGRPEFLLDMATSTIALGKVRVAAAEGRKLPPGALINEHGMATTDPSGMSGFELKGALTPLGRHKGYGLAFACEFLAGVLSRGGTLQPDNPRTGGIRNSLFSFILDPSAFGDTAWIEQEMDAMAAYALASPPMDWDSPVLYPGDPERAFRGKRDRDGIPLAEATVEALNAVARELSVPVLKTPASDQLS